LGGKTALITAIYRKNFSIRNTIFALVPKTQITDAKNIYSMNPAFSETQSHSLPLRESINEKGERISPVLPDSIRNFLIDIDGTICDDVPNEEPERMATVLPYPDALSTLNKWYNDGHIIYFFTSRTEAHREITESWLGRHGFKYHGIIFGKPRGGNYHWIDNHIVRATRFKGKFTEFIVKSTEIEVFSEEE